MATDQKKVLTIFSETFNYTEYGSTLRARQRVELDAGYETTGTLDAALADPTVVGQWHTTDYEYGSAGLIATYQDGNVTAPTRYETNVGYFDFATNKRYYYLKDHLGNVRTVVDETGAVTSWTDYHAFGAIREQNSGTSYDPYKMLNHELDIETSSESFNPVLSRMSKMSWYLCPRRFENARRMAGSRNVMRCVADGDFILW